MGVPPNHPFFLGIFHKPPAIGVAQALKCVEGQLAPKGKKAQGVPQVDESGSSFTGPAAAYDWSFTGFHLVSLYAMVQWFLKFMFFPSVMIASGSEITT
jgi:hypothetical protein